MGELARWSDCNNLTDSSYYYLIGVGSLRIFTWIAPLKINSFFFLTFVMKIDIPIKYFIQQNLPIKRKRRNRHTVMWW